MAPDLEQAARLQEPEGGEPAEVLLQTSELTAPNKQWAEGTGSTQCSCGFLLLAPACAAGGYRQLAAASLPLLQPSATATQPASMPLLGPFLPRSVWPTRFLGPVGAAAQKAWHRMSVLPTQHHRPEQASQNWARL